MLSKENVMKYEQSASADFFTIWFYSRSFIKNKQFPLNFVVCFLVSVKWNVHRNDCISLVYCYSNSYVVI